MPERSGAGYDGIMIKSQKLGCCGRLFIEPMKLGKMPISKYKQGFFFDSGSVPLHTSDFRRTKANFLCCESGFYTKSPDFCGAFFKKPPKIVKMFWNYTRIFHAFFCQNYVTFGRMFGQALGLIGISKFNFVLIGLEKKIPDT